MLGLDFTNRKKAYDYIIVGSGYGGAIFAARLASANLNPKPSICLLERGREWPVGTFPDQTASVVAALRDDTNPLGLYEFLNYQDISVIKGSGLGGTSLVNANVAIIPDPEVFAETNWPRTITRDVLMPYYLRARQVLAAGPHPHAMDLAKVQAMERRAVEFGNHAYPLNINVNFSIDGKNPYGVDQKPCTNCGDCISGCNVGAKNTLYMNYLPLARSAGTEIYTQTKVEWVEKLAAGGWRIHGSHVADDLSSQSFTLDAKNVVLAAGAINSPEILLRSEMHGLHGLAGFGNGVQRQRRFLRARLQRNVRRQRARVRFEAPGGRRSVAARSHDCQRDFLRRQRAGRGSLHRGRPFFPQRLRSGSEGGLCPSAWRCDVRWE